MDIKESISWKNFKSALIAHAGLDLQFQYQENKFVDPAYHITEVKQASIKSVDCGGIMNNWTEIVVQLWVPDEGEPAQCMKADKALSIINMVEKMLPLNQNDVVKIEFGNAGFDTSQMLVNKIALSNNSLIIDLRPGEVQCKAIDRGGSCGINSDGEECCPPTAIKPKIELVNLAASVNACCTPGTGCC